LPEREFHSRWRDAWKQLGVAPPDDKLFRELIAAYSEPRRKYHSLQHLGECLEHFDELREQAEFPPEIDLALWFHDAVYDVLRKDNEARSAEWAKASVLAASGSESSAERIHALVMATRHDAAPSGIDAQILVDVDLWILGAPQQRFDEYERQVRDEYRHVPDFLFRPKRKALLEAFLKRPRIFNTERYFERYESRARSNISRSVERPGKRAP
jgi:predicted metal-dependent HD superfamily phosphohydrolase